MPRRQKLITILILTDREKGKKELLGGWWKLEPYDYRPGHYYMGTMIKHVTDYHDPESPVHVCPEGLAAMRGKPLLHVNMNDMENTFCIITTGGQCRQSYPFRDRTELQNAKSTSLNVDAMRSRIFNATA